MLKGFKDFLMRGNVVELATAVIIGAAFTAIVTAFTEKIVNPLIASIPIGTDYSGLGFFLRHEEVTDGQGNVLAEKGMEGTFMDFGSVLTALINFVIVAAVVYFLIVLPYNKLSELRKVSEDVPDDEVSLLTEIRDLLDPSAKERKEAETAAKKAEEEAAAAAAVAQQQPKAPYGEQPEQPNYGQPGVTQQFTSPPQAAAPQPQGYEGYGQPQAPAGPQSGGFPTPNPAPGQYPPPGNLPGGQYAPGQYPPPADPGQYPPQGQFPPDGPRHSR